MLYGHVECEVEKFEVVFHLADVASILRMPISNSHDTLIWGQHDSDAQEALIQGQLPASIIYSNVGTALSWLEKGTASLDKETFARFLSILCNIWYRRNLLVHKGKLLLIGVTVHHAPVLHANYLKVTTT
ncbi:hypothetical protein V6N13_024299 [Hibiscus sabdariffa]